MIDPQPMETWDLWYPGAAATGLPFARGRLDPTDVTDETWGAKFTVMKENIEHHIEEEEGEMFRTARQVFEETELDELVDRMALRKKTAMEELFGAVR